MTEDEKKVTNQGPYPYGGIQRKREITQVDTYPGE